MSVREQFEQAFQEFSPNPDSAVYREFGELMYRAAMERAADVVEDRMRGMYARMIRAELSALDTDYGNREASKSGDMGEVVSEGGESGEGAKKTTVARNPNLPDAGCGL